MTRWKMSSMEKKSMCIFVNCSINYLVWLYKYIKRVLYIILLYKNGFLFNLGLFHEVAVNKNAEVRVLSSSELLKIVWEVEWPIKHILLRFTFPVWIWHFCLIKTLYWHVLVSWHLQLSRLPLSLWEIDRQLYKKFSVNYFQEYTCLLLEEKKKKFNSWSFSSWLSTSFCLFQFV